MKHLTVGQAGRLARAADIKQVITFHFSPIYRERAAELEVALLRAFQTTSANDHARLHRHLRLGLTALARKMLTGADMSVTHYLIGRIG